MARVVGCIVHGVALGKARAEYQNCADKKARGADGDTLRNRNAGRRNRTCGHVTLRETGLNEAVLLHP